MVQHRLQPWQGQCGRGGASAGRHAAAGHSSSIALSLGAMRTVSSWEAGLEKGLKSLYERRGDVRMETEVF